MNDELIVTHAWSLTQPWASLMAVGAKRNETRGRRGMPNFVGWIAIHATASYPPSCQQYELQEPFESALHGQIPLILGAVLGICRVIDVQPVEKVARDLDLREIAFGNYTPGEGRRAFITTDARRLRTPFACRGMLGRWRLPRPITRADLL